MNALFEVERVLDSRVEILGVGVDPVTMPTALKRIESFVEAKTPHIIVTADASGIVAAQHDQAWMDILQSADMVTPDSVGVLWASRKVGSPIEERVSGVDLVDEICKLSSSKGYRIFFLGAEPTVAENAASKMQLRHPGVNIVGTQDGYFSNADEPEIVEKIAQTKPDVLFVAMGIPRQEKFIAKYLYEIAASVNIGVGGSFDVWSGNVKRAPIVIQRMHLEWLWRTILNPKKWRKVMNLPVFWWKVMRAGKPNRTEI